MKGLGRAAAIFLALAALSGAAAPAQGSLWPGGGGPFLGVDAFVGTPSSSRDVFRSAFFGASLRCLLSPNVEISLDYAFMDIGYYYPESASGPWAGPVPWSSMPGRYAGMRDSWIFYHTKHFVSPQIWYLAPLDAFGLPLALRVGAGPAISFLVPNGAAEYYPGLAEAYGVFKESFEAYLGLSLRLGLEYRPRGFLRLGAEYLFVVDSLAGMAGDIGRYGIEYFDRAGNFIVYVGARI